MRTTVTLDPDTEQMVRERMATRGISFKQALNDAIRDGAETRADPAPRVTPVFDLGVPAVSLVKALRLAGDLEDDEVIGRLRRGA